MIKCPKCNRYSLHRVTVRVCPECGRILDAEELFRLLKELGVSGDAIEKIKTEIFYKELFSS